MTAGLVSHIQRTCLHDGPGIRTTVFLKGCPLRCRWCHNPETLAAVPEVWALARRCIRCGACTAACPVGRAGAAPVEPAVTESAAAPAAPSAAGPDQACTLCGACAEACLTGARRIAGERMSVDDVVDEVVRDAVFYQESGGGVTFSGGEPLAQPEFLRAILDALAARDIHTAVDTCGFAPASELLDIASRTGLVLYDVKMIDDAKHTAWTGMSNATILENLKALARAGTALWLRIPIMPGINDSDADVDAAAALASSLASSLPSSLASSLAPAPGGIRRIDLLPYHRMGLHKTPPSGRPDGAPALEPPTPACMERILKRFTSLGLPAGIGGR